jgi:hypothetical protein
VRLLYNGAGKGCQGAFVTIFRGAANYQQSDFDGINGALKKEESLTRDGTLWVAEEYAKF